MKLTKINKLSEKANFILLFDKISQIEKKYNFTGQEIAYIKRTLKNDKKLIVINQYDKFIFVQKIDSEKKPEQIKEKARKAAFKLLPKINSEKIKDITIVSEIGKVAEMAFVEGLMLSNYQFLKYITKEKEKKINSLEELKILNKEISKNEIEELSILNESVYRARDIVNEPFNYMNISQLTKEIEKITENTDLSLEVLNKKQIETLKMGGLLAVNQGSDKPPTFSILTWKPKNAKNKKPIILVGKGIVYDTGGASLKPSQFMSEMKSDMAGSAAVIGTMKTISETKLPLYIIGLIPITDNALSNKSYVPDDIITMHNGMTVEIGNTDAEGRLILADALSYAQKFKPELVIDLATLTGAVIRAIGHPGIGAMGTADKKTFEKLKKSGEDTYERIVEFPLWDEYKDMLKSKIADIKNIGGAYAGHITAGKFLEQFTDYKWIHLDIAATAFLTTTNDYRGKGGTGSGVRLLYDFLKRINN